jgi:LytS/YehU family sensor histidine kinase
VTSLLKLAQDWFQIKDRELNLIKENHQAQLSSLKSQINPHFLFNSLNNIYAISGDKPDAVRKYIVKLSDALRYMIYETDEKEVPLQEEINYLKDYIALEQLRMNDPNSVQFSHPENTSELIAPLILLPIVENCFKHCNKQSPDIEISIELKETNLQLIASNAIVKTVKSDQNTGGLGLENLEKRLSLLYPDRHKLTVQVADYSYRTTLMIDLRV